MQDDLLSSLDSFLSMPTGAEGLLIRDVAGQYRSAEADAVGAAGSPAVVRRARSLNLQRTMVLGTVALSLHSSPVRYVAEIHLSRFDKREGSMLVTATEFANRNRY